MLIDFHTHAFPEKIASRALASLAERAKLQPETDGTISDLLAKMDTWQVDKAVVCNIATNARQQSSVNDFAIHTKETYGDRLVPLGSVHPASPEILPEMERIHQNGLVGIKLHPDYMEKDFDDPVYAPILDTAASLGLFVVIHAGFDVYSPDHIYAPPEAILTVIKRHPHLKLVCAHYGSNCLWDSAETKLMGQHIWIDTSMGCIEGLSPTQARRMLQKHDSDRILFGSDCPWCLPTMNATWLEGLGLSDDLLEKIFYRNAQRLLAGEL